MAINFYYTAGSAACRFIQVLAKHLGIEFHSIPVDLTKKEHLSSEFLKLNPQHCLPTIVDNGFVLWESGAIAPYLVQKYGKDDSLYPEDPEKRAIVDQRLYFCMGLFYNRFGEYYRPITQGQSLPDPEKLPAVQESFELLESFLGQRAFVAGDCLTIADLALSASIATYDVGKFDRSAYKKVDAWYDRVKCSVPCFEEFNSVEVLNKIYESYLKK